MTDTSRDDGDLPGAAAPIACPAFKCPAVVLSRSGLGKSGEALRFVVDHLKSGYERQGEDETYRTPPETSPLFASADCQQAGPVWAASEAATSFLPIPHTTSSFLRCGAQVGLEEVGVMGWGRAPKELTLHERRHGEGAPALAMYPLYPPWVSLAGSVGWSGGPCASAGAAPTLRARACPSPLTGAGRAGASSWHTPPLGAAACRTPAPTTHNRLKHMG